MNRNPPTLAELSRYDVNRVNLTEGVWAPLFDSATYAAGGQAELSFFTNTANKTKAQTNMKGAGGAMPYPIQFLVTAISLSFFPGPNPGKTPSAPAAQNFVNDVYAFAKGGFLELEIGNKTYVEDGPLEKFPSPNRLQVNSALSDSTTAGASGFTAVDYAAVAGRVYEVAWLRIPPTQNFSLKLKWPTAVALPSGQAGTVFATLWGWQYRFSQ